MPEIKLDKLLRQQAALTAFGSYAFREVNLMLILTEAARLCAESLNTPFCKICKYRPETNDLFVVAGVGWRTDVVGAVISAADMTTPQGRAFITREAVILDNVQKMGELMLAPLYHEHGINSTVDVCIQSAQAGSPPWGVLEVDSAEEDFVYEEQDVIFLKGYANILAESAAAVDRNQALQALVDEKVILAQELQHRVRNNLHLINGMLMDQLRLLHDDRAKNGIHGIIRRVMSLSRVYDQLLGVGMRREVDFAEYIKLLCASLPELQQETNQITLILNVVPMLLDLDTVTALGLAMVEIVSNSYEHAFPKRDGQIVITLSLDSPGHAILEIKDNGIGYVESEQTNKRHGVGLVRRLLQQAKGTAQRMDVALGTHWMMRFPVPVSGVLNSPAD